MRRALLLGLAVICVAPATVAVAQTVSSRTLELRFTPAARVQLAILIVAPDGTFEKTVGLTQAVGYRGIGNRPGASEMNSGFRWPYGRREGALPVWAHRRAAAPGAMQFRRVIFQDRLSEGDASRTSNDSSRESYFCHSFMSDLSRRDALDAVTCATSFNSDKGRFIADSDVASGYAEPTETSGQGVMRPLDLVSLYPPRRDVTRCSSGLNCYDHPDVAGYGSHAEQVMPDIDTVTMATPPGGDQEQSVLFSVPNEWADGPYVAWIEVSNEGDYNDVFNDRTFPTPSQPSTSWDIWAETYGYPYRGQPSVVYQVPFNLAQAGTAASSVAFGYGDVNGFGDDGGKVLPMDGTVITDDPDGSPGSGADRLRLMPQKGYRFQVQVRLASDCMGDVPPAIPTSVSASPDPDGKHSHQWGVLHFVVPTTNEPVDHYEVRYSNLPIAPGDDASFSRALPAVSASIDASGLQVPITDSAGTGVDVHFGGMGPTTHYWVAIRAVDKCNRAGPFAVAELTTTRINFTQLSGCFVATAAYGSPLEPEVGALRAVRDSLRPRSVWFAVATDLYYRSGPAAASLIARSEVARAVVRTLLGPAVGAARDAAPLLSPHRAGLSAAF